MSKKNNHGVYITFWDFKAGKSFGVSIDTVDTIAQNKKDWRGTFVISNNPHYFTDLYFSSPDQLFTIIKLLEKYCIDSNDDLLYYYYAELKYKDIIFIIDEAHLYFDSRNFSSASSLISSINLILTQSRKRKIRFEIITQRPSSIDIRFRRLADFIIKYNRIKFFKRYITLKYIYKALWDSTYVEDPSQHDIESKRLHTSLFSANTSVLREYWANNEKYLKLKNQEHLTWHIVGLEDDTVKIPENLDVLLYMKTPING